MVKAQWIGWQAGWDRQFWPHMTQRCADQDDLEHGALRLGCDADGRRGPTIESVGISPLGVDYLLMQVGGYRPQFRPHRR